MEKHRYIGEAVDDNDYTNNLYFPRKGRGNIDNTGYWLPEKSMQLASLNVIIVGYSGDIGSIYYGGVDGGKSARPLVTIPRDSFEEIENMEIR